ncbi:MAG: DCC1-like thiol-disulfide oxidoreductase family protein [Planctomycetota bacterium]
MPALSSLQRLVLAVLALGWLAVVVGSHFVVPALITSAFDGEANEWLNTKIANHRAYRAGADLDASREWYVAWARSYAIKASALATLFAGTLAAVVALPAVRRRFKRFLFASVSPLNLAILRVAAFGMILFLLNTEKILYYAAWPRELYQWPVLAELFYKFLPITTEVATPLLAIAKVTATLTIVGFFTRFNAVVTIVLGTYLIGIPQLSGKVNHIHHVLIIGTILACSRCGDALSLDALWRAIRRADRGVVAPPNRAVRYGMPIRLAMLALATVYFFPGFWKIASNGPQWVFSDNLQNHMLQKWFELEHYTPPLPLHEMPFSGPGGALFAVVFELGIPLALLWKPTRMLWAAMGLTFHNLTFLLMKISFMTLQWMYVMFVDWQRLFAWVGRRLFGEPIRVLYDGNCGLCRRTMAVLGVLDWLQVLRPVNALNRELVEQERLGFLEDAALMQDMHAAWFGGDGEWQSAKGYAAYQQIAWRVPLLWLTLPLIYLPPVAAIGRQVYRRVADSRACRVPTATRGGAAPIRSTLAWTWQPLALVAGVLLAGQCVLGAGRLHKAWPIACYPLFDQIEGTFVIWPEFEVVTSDGRTTPLDDDPLRDAMGNARYVASMEALVETPLDEERAKEILAKFAGAWRNADALPEETAIDRLVITRATYELVGPQRPEQPTETEPLAEFAWGEIASESK